MAIKLLKDGEEFTVVDADLVAEGDKGTTYTLRHVTPEKNREIRDRHKTRVLNKRTHQYDVTYDNDAIGDDLLDHILVNWTGVDDDSKPAPCDREHKLRLDPYRRQALMEKAGLNEVLDASERRAESFRAPRKVG